MYLDIFKTELGTLVLFKREKTPVALLYLDKQEVYVYAEKKKYPVAEAVKKYPSACDFPVGVSL